MPALLHPPRLADPPEGLSAEQRRRLLETVTRAIERAAQTAPPRARPQWVATARPAAGAAPPPGARGRPRERVGMPAPSAGADSGDDGDGGPTVAIPSYDDHGRPVRLPLARTTATASGDRIVEGEFPVRVVARAAGNVLIHAGGRPYAETVSLARALQWGRILFGGRGFAVMTPVDPGEGGERARSYYSVGLTKTVTARAMGGGHPQAPGELAGVGGRKGHLVDSLDYQPVLFETADDLTVFRIGEKERWSVEAVKREIGQTPREQATVSAEDRRRAGAALLDRRDDATTVAALVNFDRTMFAAMPWEEREHFIELLVDAWTGAREERAIVELIHATRTSGELEAIFAVLRSRGVYGRLFRDLDGEVSSLLTLLGEFRGAPAADWQYLAKVLVGFGVLTPGGVSFSGAGDPLHEIKLAVEGVGQWVEGTLRGLWELLSHPDQVLEGIGHLAELAWVWERARWGDEDARRLLAQMAQQIGRQIALLLRGLEYADEVGTAIDRRGRGERVSHDLLGRVKAMVIAEIASWFIGIGEVRMAISAGGELAERIAALARVLAGLGAIAKAGETAGDATRVERVLAALARAAEIDEAARLERIVGALPETHADALRRIAAHAELPDGAELAALRAAVASHPELAGAVDRLLDALRATARLEARAAEAGAELAELLPGFHRLLRDTRLEAGALSRAIDEVPAANLRELMHTVEFVGPEQLARFSAADLAALGTRPRAMAFAREIGGEAFVSVFGRQGGEWTRLDGFLEGLAEHRATIPSPDEWQRFLDGLAHGDREAFDAVAEALNARRASEARAAGTLEAHVRSRLAGRRPALLEHLRESDVLPHQLESLARLRERELDGLEQIASHIVDDHEGKPALDVLDVLDALDAAGPAARADILGLFAEIGPHVTGGLDDVMHLMFQLGGSPGGGLLMMRGSEGELRAARTAMHRFQLSELSFQADATGRRIDIVGRGGPHGELHIEVKTNNVGTAELSPTQVPRDLVRYAPDGYRGLRYLYHPNSTGDLPRLARQMRGWLERPEVLSGLRGHGISLQDAQRAFDAWLANGGMGIY